jgi:hypothetical protein
MIFDEIYQCALEQNAEKLKKILAPKVQNPHGLFKTPSSLISHKKLNIDIYRTDRPFISPAAQLVLDGEKAAAEFLLQQGGSISCVLIAAASMKDNPYVENLLKRGALIKYAVMGAAMLGKKNDANVLSLLKRKADINYAVWGAAMAGQFIYAIEFLVKVRRGSINYVALGAAQAGRLNDAVKLYNGVEGEIDPNFIADGAIMGGFITDSMESQLNYLPHFNINKLPQLINAFRNTCEDPVIIDKTTEERIIAMSQLMHTKQINHAQALTQTDPKCQGMLFLLMMITKKKLMIIATKDGSTAIDKTTKLPCLPFDIWLYIFNFVTPAKLLNNEFNNLAAIANFTNKSEHHSSPKVFVTTSNASLARLGVCLILSN